VTWVWIALKFLKANWKTVLVILIVGGIIAGVASLYGAYQIEKGRAAKFQAERDAAHLMLESCIAVNKDWDHTAAMWNKAVDDLQAEADAYQSRLAAERERRRTSESRLAELESAISDQITATDCEGALDQLIDALGWGVP
jgi:gas vesicle protein